MPQYFTSLRYTIFDCKEGMSLPFCGTICTKAHFNLKSGLFQNQLEKILAEF